MLLKMQKWITDRLESVPSATVFNLMHASVDIMGSDLILRIDVGSKGEDRKGLDDEVERIVAAANEAAIQHANAFSGMRQRYKLTAETNEGALGQFTFQLGSSEPQADVGFSEGATEKGLLGQLMRHNENSQRAFVDLANSTVGPLLSENQSLRRQRDDWESKRLDAHLTLEELLSHKHERDIELEQYSEEERRKNKAWNALLDKWGPEIIRRIDLPFLQPPKQIGEANGANGSNGQPTVGHLQEALRSIFKLIERAPIFDCLEDEQKHQLDSLLGLGDDPTDVPTFKKELLTIWQMLPDEITTSIGEDLLEKDKSKAALFVDLLR